MAMDKGYDIFDYDGTGMLEIEKVDDSKRFKTDEEAVADEMKERKQLVVKMKKQIMTSEKWKKHSLDILEFIQKKNLIFLRKYKKNIILNPILFKRVCLCKISFISFQGF